MLHNFSLRLRYPGRFYRPDTPDGADAYHRLAKLLAFPELRMRARIPATTETICPDKGYLITSIRMPQQVIDRAEAMDWTAEAVGSKKEFLIVSSLPQDTWVREIADQLLPIAAEYIGSLPVLQSAQFWYSQNTTIAFGRSQSWHMDGEDRRQLKCLLPLRSIDQDTGPLTLLPAAVSARVYRELVSDGLTKRRNFKITDNDMKRYFDPSEVIQLTGEPGTAGMVDTCRCYHFGSRKAPKARLLMFLHFTSAYSIEMPIFRRGAADLVYDLADRMFPAVRFRRG